jgi:hypothetical protein
LLAYAKRADDDGRLSVNGEPMEGEDLAQSIPGVFAEAVETCLRELEEIGVLVRDGDDVLRFAAWERRAAGKPSDARSAIAERVRRSRQRAREKSAQAAVTPCNALLAAHGNATEREVELERRDRAKKKSESGEHDAPASSSSSSNALPTAATQLLEQLEPAKRGHALREMRQVLNGGCSYRGSLVRATSARLDAKCRETLTMIGLDKLRSPTTKGWTYALAKLADVSDGSAPGLDEVAGRVGAERIDVANLAAANEWLRAHPATATAIERELVAQGLSPSDDGAVGVAYRMARDAWIVAAWRALAGGTE